MCVRVCVCLCACSCMCANDPPHSNYAVKCKSADENSHEEGVDLGRLILNHIK